MDLRALAAFAADHHGLVTRQAAARLGVGKTTWFRAVADGRLDEVHPGVAALPGSPRSREQAIAAAVLATMPSVASHTSAAHLWGIPRRHNDPVEVIVTRRTRTPELDGVIVHRPRDLRDLTPVLRANIPTTNVLRLLCDLGAVDPAAVPDAVGHVVTARLASPVALRDAIDRHARRGRHGVPAFRDALDSWVIDGKPVDSKLEAAMRRLFERHRLPPFEFHPRIAGLEVDFRIVGTRIVLECDGWEFHAKTRAQQERDAARDAHLAEHGFVVVRFTYHQIVREQAKQARKIWAILDRWAPELGALRPGSGTQRSQMAE